jgi:hypothetical protein
MKNFINQNGIKGEKRFYPGSSDFLMPDFDSSFDPLGSYTGNSDYERPEQDADDL